MKQKIFKLHGQVQHYAWGGYDYIPALLGFDNAQHKPCAEYWLGAHPSASGQVDTDDGTMHLNDLVKENPEAYLGEEIYNKFGELPYLLKVLDVREMLSIQVHPSRHEAAKGFAAEEAAGVPLTAKNRNYKDPNHKPEIMIALGNFWLLHGFKKKEELQLVLQHTKEFAGLQKIFDEQNYFGLYKHVMEMPQHQADSMLLPLIHREATLPQSKHEPGYWVNKLYGSNIPKDNTDRGIFSIYFFNIVHLRQGQGIFQAAGVPHAYLEGQNVELMANSDNVLRGGLTPKHIDVPELLKHTIFEAVDPQVLAVEETAKGERIYCQPAEDFGLCILHIASGREYVNESTSPEIFLVMDGTVHCGPVDAARGESFLVLPGVTYTLRAVADAVVYKAFVPVG